MDADALANVASTARVVGGLLFLWAVCWFAWGGWLTMPERWKARLLTGIRRLRRRDRAGGLVEGPAAITPPAVVTDLRVRRHDGYAGCGGPAFYVEFVNRHHPFAGTTVRLLDGSSPEIGTLLLCGTCGRHCYQTAGVTPWFEDPVPDSPRRRV